jgi:hypothetical protein
MRKVLQSKTNTTMFYFLHQNNTGPNRIRLATITTFIRDQPDI